MAFQLKALSSVTPFAEKTPIECAPHEMEKVDLIYVLGVIGAQSYVKVKEWLEAHPQRQLVILEHDEQMLGNWLASPQATEILSHKQVRVCHFELHNPEDAVFAWLNAYFVKMKPLVLATLHYQQNHLETVNVLQERLLRNHASGARIVDEFLQLGRVFYQNFYANARKLHGAYPAHALFQKFHNVPAIICGAGPSLNKNVHLLRGLEERALIFAPGSSFNVLNAHQIIPHFGAGVDPHPPQIERLKQQSSFETPFFYRQRWNSDALAQLHSQRLYMRGACGYPVVEWLEECLGIQGPVLDEGDNVVHECMHIAYAMGCNPIIFVGMDLAYTQNKLYASGVVPERENLTIEPECHYDQPVLSKDVDGKEIWTHWKWLSEAEWITRFVSNVSQQHADKCFINATEGGLGLKNVASMSLQEAKDQFLLKSYPLQQRIHQEFEAVRALHAPRNHIEEAFQTLKISLELCLNKIEQIIAELQCRQLQKRSGWAVLLEVELEEELAFQVILAPMLQVYDATLYRRLDSVVKEEEENLRIAQQLTIDYERYVFLLQAAQENLRMMICLPQSREA
jgi:hypothetical protein